MSQSRTCVVCAMATTTLLLGVVALLAAARGILLAQRSSLPPLPSSLALAEVDALFEAATGNTAKTIAVYEKVLKYEEIARVREATRELAELEAAAAKGEAIVLSVRDFRSSGPHDDEAILAAVAKAKDLRGRHPDKRVVVHLPDLQLDVDLAAANKRENTWEEAKATTKTPTTTKEQRKAERRRRKRRQVVVDDDAVPATAYRRPTKYRLKAPISLSGLQGIELRIDGHLKAPQYHEIDDATKLAPPTETTTWSTTTTTPETTTPETTPETTTTTPPASRRSPPTPEEERLEFAVVEIADSTDVAVSGSGSVDGRGARWWRKRKADPSMKAPVLLLIRDSSNVRIRHLLLQNSPFYHVVLLRSTRVVVDRVHVFAPAGSVNTDGVDVLGSRDVAIRRCVVSTGDDNVAVKEGSTNVAVTGGIFYRGHGLSVGSLGERGTTASVSDLRLADVRFVRTSNAARVKTWQGGRGAVTNVTFANLKVHAVGTPLVVTQFYCPRSQHPAPCANSTDAVAISDLTVDAIAGWHTSGVAAQIHCSQATPCRVAFRDLNLRPAPGCSNVVQCLNVRPQPIRGRLDSTCANGDAMFGFRLDLSRRDQSLLARNRSCVHPQRTPREHR